MKEKMDEFKSKFNNLKLTPKLAITIGTSLVLIFTILIVSVGSMFKSSMSKAVTRELLATAQANAKQVEQIIASAGSVAMDLESYMQNTYADIVNHENRQKLPTAPGTVALFRSEIFGQTLTPFNYDFEHYLTQTIQNIIANNDDIMGVGFYAEPFAIQDSIENFSLYIDKEVIESGRIRPFGAYDTFCNESYYAEATKAGETVVTAPYTLNGYDVVSYAIPVIIDGVQKAVISADVRVSMFDKISTKSDVYDSMYSTIYDENLIAIYDSEDDTKIGKNISQFIKKSKEMTELNELIAKGEAFQIEMTSIEGQKITRFFQPIPVANETWWSLTALETSDMTRSATTAIIVLLVFMLIALAIVLCVTIFMLRSMLRPLNPVVEAADEIVKGNFDIVLHNDNADEIGILSRSFMSMTESLRTIIGDIAYVTGEMTQGNFRVKTKVEEMYVGSYRDILMALRELNQRLSETLHSIKSGAEQVSVGSEQLSESAQSVSEGATEQAGAVEELQATISDITGQVEANAQASTEAAKAAEEVAAKAEISRQEISGMTEAMFQISETSKQISNIIGEIEDIASQTNLLSLNAAIEAARAGDAGRGFAVVADQIRKLAENSAASAVRTKKLIETSIHEVERGNQITEKTVTAMNEVMEGIRMIAEGVQTTNQNSMQQAELMSQLEMGVEQIAEVVQANSAVAGEVAATSDELTAQAAALNEMTNQFKLKD